MRKKSPIDEKLWHARQDLSTILKRAMDQRFPAVNNTALALEKASGVSDSVIRRLRDDPHALKKGNVIYYPKLDTLIRLADALALPVAELVRVLHIDPGPTPQSGGGGTRKAAEPNTVAEPEPDPAPTPGRRQIHEPA